MDIQQSVDRILNSGELLGESFYEVFFERFPEVRAHFEGVNLVRQGVLLTTALVLIERYYATPNRPLEQYLQYLGTKHAERKIPRELYEGWRVAMLETLARFHGSEWDDILATEWDAAIRQAAEKMFEGYEQHFHV